MATTTCWQDSTCNWHSGEVTTDDEFAAKVRADLIRIFGPEVVYEALYSDEARSYIAARQEVDAREAAYLAVMQEWMQKFADGLNDGSIPLQGGVTLPEGMRFEWG